MSLASITVYNKRLFYGCFPDLMQDLQQTSVDLVKSQDENEKRAQELSSVTSDLQAKSSQVQKPNVFIALDPVSSNHQLNNKTHSNILIFLSSQLIKVIYAA